MQNEREKLIERLRGEIYAILAREFPGSKQVAAIDKAISAALATMEAQPVGVKALEWDRYSSRGGEVANTVVGLYQIVPYHEHFGLIAPGGSLDSFSYAFVGPLPTVKAEAQADYERRILSALSPVAVGRVTDEMVEAAAERLRENLTSFDREVEFELSTEGERADLWTDIDVNVDDLRTVLAALCQAKPETDGQAALRQPASPVAEGWRPISEATDQTAAPWDGVPVLIATNHNWGGPANRIHRAKWTDEVHGSGIFGWAIEDLKHGPYPLRGYTLVTHWMPLPPLPASPQEGI